MLQATTQQTACGSLGGVAQPKTLSGRTRQRRAAEAPLAEDYAVSHWLSAAADVRGHASLSRMLYWRVRRLSAMFHRAGGLLETCVSMPIASRVCSRGES